MIGEKFYNSVSCLSASELNACIRYSMSELFNKRTEITKTIKFFKKNKEEFFLLLNDEENTFKKFLGRKVKFDRKLLTDHFHLCLNLLENFIVFTEIQKDKDAQLKLVENFYKERSYQSEAESINAKRIKIVSNEDISIDSYLTLYKLYINRFHILVKQFENETFENIEIALNNLDKFYFLAKMHWSQELEALNVVRKFDYDKRLMNEIKELILNDDELTKKLLFKIYLITNDLYNGKFTKEGYYEFKQVILKNLDRFEFKTKKQFLTDLSNYVSFMYGKSPVLEWLKESHEVLKMQIKSKTLVVENHLAEPSYALGIRVALNLEEYEWANKFIADYSQYITNEVLIQKMKAEVLYNLNKHDEALEIINEIPLKSFSDNYEMKTLYAKILFDKKQYDLLENHLKTYELYIRRYKESSDDIKDRNLRYVLYLGRLFRNINHSKRIEKLFKEVSEDNKVFYKNWLLARISLFIK